ncbi:hypothetical protein [Bradyrhizobium sp. ORS 375]|uniref:hypothetical protein n=1 Tax=Bradyrhizobium sp. (strain ORS 375) TaxID=566679 RepID=UPI00031A334E|nr:hypothetical protein [Bradyrhizobium sp. ORS 375]
MLLAGLIILAAVYGGLGVTPFPAAWFLFLAPLLFTALNAAWIAVAAGVLMYGMARNRPGLMAAPPVFFACWCAASIVDRTMVASSADPVLFRRDVPADLRELRSLTVVGNGSSRGYARLLADGTIDQYVQATEAGTGGPGLIRMTRLAEVQQCSSGDMRASDSLQAAGRIDQCLRTTTIDAIPDGLVVRMTLQQAYGCCAEGTISIRRNGEETVAATWRSERRRVLSYVPLFGPVGDGPTPATSLWKGGAGGPWQVVWAGKPGFSETDLAAAVYGIDWNAPLDIVQVDNAELARRAAEISKGPNHDAALDLALELQRRNYTGDDVLGIVASKIEWAFSGSNVERKASEFFRHLRPLEKARFVDLILDRIQDPSIGSDNLHTEFGFNTSFETAQSERALRIFEQRNDLKVWQYEQALRIAQDGRIRFAPDEFAAEQDRRFAFLRQDASPAFVRRTLAFGQVYFRPRDHQRDYFGSQLDRVPDAMIEEFLRAVGWFHSYDETTTTEATRRLRDRAAIRIAAVIDAKLRRDLQDRFRLDLNR